jgi:hypothetical protein
MTSITYEIRVAGTIPPEALIDFEQLTADVRPVETVVHGPLQDHAALAGLLALLAARLWHAEPEGATRIQSARTAHA